MDPLSVHNPQALWEKTQQHSSDLCKKLALSPDDLEFIQKNNICGRAGGDAGFLSVVVLDKEFRLLVSRVSGVRNIGNRQWLLLAYCVNDIAINKFIDTSSFVSCISDEWHTLLLNQLPEDAAGYLRNKISDLTAKQANLWKQAKQHSADMCELLGVRKQDLSRIRVCRVAEHTDGGTFGCAIEGKEFRFSVSNTCGSLYGGGWEYLIQAVCVNDASLNECIGGGTTLVTVLDKQWHRLLMLESNRHIFDGIKKRISDAAMCNEQIWEHALQHSAEIYLALGCSGEDDKVLEKFLPERQPYTTLGPFVGETVYECSVENKEFALCLLETYGGNYRDTWKKMIQVVCLNDMTLNQSVGGGTSFVNIIDITWHLKLLDRLRQLSCDDCLL